MKLYQLLKECYKGHQIRHEHAGNETRRHKHHGLYTLDESEGRVQYGFLHKVAHGLPLQDQGQI